MEWIRQKKYILKTHAAEIAANKEFRRSVIVPKIVKIDIEQGRYVTNCVICNFTCHIIIAYMLMMMIKLIVVQ